MTDTILDASLRREVYRARFASYLKNQYVDSAVQELSLVIPQIISKYDYPDLTRREVRQLSAEVRSAIIQRWSPMWEEVTEELKRLAVLEVEAFKDLYDDFIEQPLAIPSESQILAAVTSASLTLASGDKVDAGTWAEYLRNNQSATTRLVDGLIQVGVQEGFTIQEINRQLRGTYNRRTKKYEGGILQGKTTRWSETLARTGVSHYANIARDRAAQLNLDAIEQRVLIATLDNRTTFICRSRHQQRWSLDDDNYPRLPFHYNERSVWVYLPKDAKLRGTQASVGGRSANEQDYIEKPRYRGKGSLDVYKPQQVSADVSMADWLRRQPRAFVDSALGDTRAALFLDGKLELQNFVDLQGRVLTLDELRATIAGERAWRRAMGG